VSHDHRSDRLSRPLDAPPTEPADAPKRIRLRYSGTCILCGLELIRGAEALYDKRSRTVRCIECPAKFSEPPPIKTGTAGASARQEYERRHASREAKVRAHLGNVFGGVVLAVTDDPQSTRAWARGAIGEEKLAQALARVDGLTVLQDRRVPGTRGNIDQIIISPAGVFVVDAKFYKGLIRMRDVGGWFKTDLRLYVGSRDCSKLADNMGWQAEAVQRVLDATSLGGPPVTAVLCFVDGDWPLISPPESYKGVRLEGKRSIKKLVTKSNVLSAREIEQLVRVLATAFPPK
jgi:Nuclease-related domain